MWYSWCYLIGVNVGGIMDGVAVAYIEKSAAVGVDGLMAWHGCVLETRRQRSVAQRQHQ